MGLNSIDLHKGKFTYKIKRFTNNRSSQLFKCTYDIKILNWTKLEILVTFIYFIISCQSDNLSLLELFANIFQFLRGVTCQPFNDVKNLTMWTVDILILIITLNFFLVNILIKKTVIFSKHIKICLQKFFNYWFVFFKILNYHIWPIVFLNI